MKKFTTMLGVLALCGGSAIAATGMTVDPGVRNDLKVTGVTPAFTQKMVEGKALGDVLSTRNYVDQSGMIWEETFQMYQETLAEMLTFNDDNGNPFKPSFDQLPYYCVQYTLSGTPQGATTPENLVIFNLVWPSEYMYEQVWSYTGELDIIDGKAQIPVALREYQPASFEDLCNNTSRCQLFREADGVGVGDPVNGKYSYYTMLPNEMLGIFMRVKTNQLATTIINPTTASQLSFTEFDPETFYMDNRTNVYYTLINSETGQIINPNQILRLSVFYKGEVELQGIVPTLTECPEFGDMHLFNGGVISSDQLGDNNPFPADFGEMTQMAFAIGDKNMTPDLNPTATVFNPSTFFESTPAQRADFYMNNSNLPKGEERDHSNVFLGYLYTDAKYGKDINLALNPEDFKLFQQVKAEQIDLGENEWFAVAAPEVGGLIPYGIGTSQGTMEPWSYTYGAYLEYRGLGQTGANTPVYMGWGFTDGFILHFENEFLNTIEAKSTGKLYYHYDPKDVQKYKEFELVGTADKDAVETVEAENAQIVAANGAITVVPAADAEVAVFGLDGVCLKNVKATAGETVNVEAQKGVYVVVVNGASKKVAL
ncbi:MAG: hypothetical protein HDT05_05875 [Bacteroidales bacterium]|nr:hypothetical protein [Bacteroidales bacterium]